MYSRCSCLVLACCPATSPPFHRQKIAAVATRRIRRPQGHPKIKYQRPKVKSQKSKVKSQKSKVKSQKSKVKSQKSKVKKSCSEARTSTTPATPRNRSSSSQRCRRLDQRSGKRGRAQNPKAWRTSKSWPAPWPAPANRTACRWC